MCLHVCDVSLCVLACECMRLCRDACEYVWAYKYGGVFVNACDYMGLCAHACECVSMYVCACM